jgi:hypothetical protein
MSKNGLDRLNIENLFSCENSKPITNGKLDINTLFKKNIITENEVIFSSEILLNNIIKKKKKIKETYTIMYKSCCDKIISANAVGITDIIYEIPSTVQKCIDYNSYDCLILIKDKLQEQHMLSTIISPNKIFITWNDIEKKLSIEK